MNKKDREFGDTSKKIIILLAGGICLGLSRNPKQYFRVLKSIKGGWNNIKTESLHRAIKNLYVSKMIFAKEMKDGTVEIILSEKGKNRALKYNLDKITIPTMNKWDNKWRVVSFDIPEKRKKSREAIRYHLKQIGFIEFQKSVFIHPFECQNEIDYLIEFYHLKPFIRVMLVEKIDNELHLKKKFDLL